MIFAGVLKARGYILRKSQGRFSRCLLFSLMGGVLLMQFSYP